MSFSWSMTGTSIAADDYSTYWVKQEEISQAVKQTKKIKMYKYLWVTETLNNILS